MAVPRRVWDTSVIIDYLEGTERAREHVPLIISEAARGETRILVSAWAEIEVVRLDSTLTDKEEWSLPQRPPDELLALPVQDDLPLTIALGTAAVIGAGPLPSLAAHKAPRWHVPQGDERLQERPAHFADHGH